MSSIFSLMNSSAKDRECGEGVEDSGCEMVLDPEEDSSNGSSVGVLIG